MGVQIVRIIYNYHHSTKLCRKISQVCYHLYCYECIARVTMPMVTNGWYSFQVQLSIMVIMILSYEPLIPMHVQTQCTWLAVPEQILTWLVVLTWTLTWLVVLIRILAWLAIKNKNKMFCGVTFEMCTVSCKSSS